MPVPASTPATSPVTSPVAPPLFVSLRRVIALAAIAGYVEVIGFLDIGGVYPGIMTGNTVELGLTFARGQWPRFLLIGLAVALFFIGGIVASLLKRHLRRPGVELVVAAAVLVAASVVRLRAGAGVPLELPLLGLAMAMQGETVSTFGGVSIQTIVVTNNMVKFSDALVGRYLSGWFGRRPGEKVPSLGEVLLPGLAWLFYGLAAGVGALAAGLRLPLLAPAALLVLVAGDLLLTGQDAPKSEPRPAPSSIAGDAPKRERV
ncbi:YoaK family protein [Robbsia sp. Bb-Pol-6]|uniref:YoaK family protein n=1 Tax=Robbsia betulipollinis TaxID=2981849 RepID=A0ABT3ZIY6_9BURK|nr:YoaK family protein [Robbsia betulipollinis]MCY0386484.1 YoaK family protein [Robbsia betulipollinis]